MTPPGGPSILVTPDSLEAKASLIRQKADRIQDLLNLVDQEIRKYGPDVFMGNRAESLRGNYVGASRDVLPTFVPTIQQFVSFLEQTAQAFRAADRAAQA
jgi:uncharacterized protein YukE